MSRSFVLGLFLAASAAHAQRDPTWREPTDPVRIAAGVYYVGTRGLSSFLVVTKEGSILLDTGEAQSVPLIRASIEKLGFRIEDVRWILSGHAHFDHVGGHARMGKLTGAKVAVMAADRDAVASGVDRSALAGPGWDAVKVDRVLEDGDKLSVGGTTLTAHLTAGHTQGCTTWTTEVVENGKPLRVAFVCSVTINEGVHLVGNSRVPAIADQYAHTFRVLHGLAPDVWVAEHPGVFDFAAKAPRARAGGSNPFVDPDGYARFVERSERAYLEQLDREKKR